MLEIIFLLQFIMSVVIALYVARAYGAIIESEKHLRVIAWEMQKAAKAQQNELPP